MTPEQQIEEANRILRDHLDDGIEFLAVNEILWENSDEEPSEEDVSEVYALVSNALANLSRTAKVV